ncbi:MAG: DEAD/DEAH box helicase [Acidobacteriota bacterium]
MAIDDPVTEPTEDSTSTPTDVTGSSPPEETPSPSVEAPPAEVEVRPDDAGETTATEPADPAAESDAPPSDDVASPLVAPEEPSDDAPFAGAPEPLRLAMEARGFTGLTPVQRTVAAAGHDGRDLRITSQTGSGKTVALGMVLASELMDEVPEGPLAGPLVLIVTPTRELASQVAEELGWLYRRLSRARVDVVTGGTDVGRERRRLARPPEVLVGTPGRLLDHLEHGGFDGSGVRQVVLDEADQMLDLGFRDDLEAILEKLPEQRRSHLVSATFPRDVQQLADKFQSDPLHLEGTTLGAANTDIEHVAHLVRDADRYAALVNVLLTTQPGDRCLVFVQRRVDATELSERLAADGFAALPMSGELPQAQRTRTLRAFRNGIVGTLVATDVAARGIDVPDISLVIHGDLPFDGDVYTHRSGRTGRAGKTGRSVLLVPVQARRRVDRILGQARVQTKWKSVPAADAIEKAVDKQVRRDLHARLADEGLAPSEKQLEQAQRLLEERDAAHLIATLLDQSRPRLPRSPFNVPDPPQPRDRYDRRGDRRPYDRDRRDGPDRGPRPTGPRGPRRDAPGEFVRYFMNSGSDEGLTPSRLLPYLCRRGNISGEQVGAIRVEGRSTTFDVHSSVADAFEQKACRPDPGKPGLRIARHHQQGPREGGGGGGDRRPPHRGGPGGGPGGGKGGRPPWKRGGGPPRRDDRRGPRKPRD